MNKDTVQTHNVILLSHKKEQNWVICKDVDGPRDCDRKSGKEKQILYINVKSLEKSLMLEKIKGMKKKGRRRWDGWMASSTQ